MDSSANFKTCVTEIWVQNNESYSAKLHEDGGVVFEALDHATMTLSLTAPLAWQIGGNSHTQAWGSPSLANAVGWQVRIF